MIHPFAFNTCPSVVFGAGAIDRLGELAAGRLGQRILLITDPGLVEIGLITPAVQVLESAGLAVSVYADILPDPPQVVVRDATRAAMEYQATGIIGIGGGSSLDVAKLAAVLAPGRENLTDIYGVGKVIGPRLPLLLAPTTAGTGSEVTPIAIVTTGSSEKMGVVSPVLLPDIALLDPQLTRGLPPMITAATGMDAMVHAIEAYASANANNNPVSRTLACQAMLLMGRSLETAVHTGDDLSARSEMLIGAMLAGQAFANSPVAAVHALAYPIGGHFHVPHGLSNALVLAHVLRFNAEVAPEPYAELAPFAFPALSHVPPHARTEAFIDALVALSTRCGLPQRLRDVGIPRDALAKLAADAMNQTRLLVNNPRAVTEADARAIYEAAW